MSGNCPGTWTFQEERRTRIKKPKFTDTLFFLSGTSFQRFGPEIIYLKTKQNKKIFGAQKGKLQFYKLPNMGQLTPL